jgi:two-component system nitrogen regulation sensor histidine kinase NtrY
MSQDPSALDATAGAAPAILLWRRLVAWVEQHRVMRFVEIGVAISALAMGVLTYVAMTPGATRELSTREIQVMLLSDLVALLALTSLVARRLVMLWMQRRRGVAGSRLHARMVVLFAVVSSAPAVLMSVFAVLFFNLGLQTWFSDRVNTAVKASVAVAESYSLEHRKTIRADMLGMAVDLNREAPRLVRNPILFHQAVSTLARLRGLGEAMVFTSTREILAQTRLGMQFDLDQITDAMLQDAAAGQLVFIAADSDERVRGLMKLDGFVDVFLYVGRFIDSQVLADLERTRSAAAQYNRLEAERSALEVRFAGLFILVSLLLLLASIWFSLLIATRLATPIGEVVTAAERISAGELAVRVTERPGDDEIGNLGRAFNRMTGQLAAQQSQLIAANRQLDERRRFTETVLAGVSAGVIGVDLAGKVTLPNPSALHLLAAGFDDVVGKPFDEVAPEMAGLLSHLYENPGEQVARGQVVLHREAEARTLLVRVAREITGNELLGYVVTFDDVTELVAAQRNAAWADIARRIAHEIKNPLTPIQLSAERLKRKYLKEVTTDPEIFAQCTDTIIRQVGDIGRMVDEFSAFARMPRPVYREEDLSQIVRQAVFMQQVARADVRFESRLPTDPVWLKCDARQISQVLTNLLQNALDAIDGRERDGEVPLPQGRIELELHLEAAEAQLLILDNGRGLPAELRGRLFEPYVTTRAKGTGLGLAIVKKIIEEHGGQIALEDGRAFDPDAKSGSLARIRMPLAPTTGQKQEGGSGPEAIKHMVGVGGHGA